jgi:hypothetical protein
MDGLLNFMLKRNLINVSEKESIGWLEAETKEEK